MAVFKEAPEKIVKDVHLGLQCPNNSQSVSKLPLMGKLMEWVVASQLSSWYSDMDFRQDFTPNGVL